jgi:hypothetical protein
MAASLKSLVAQVKLLCAALLLKSFAAPLSNASVPEEFSDMWGHMGGYSGRQKPLFDASSSRFERLQF